MGKPEPAYDHQFRMCADRAPAPVATNGTVFIPSATGDQVLACSLASGKIVWRFVTEGPVRFAPVVADGKVIFGCDDGYLYAVGTVTGELIWKTRGVDPSFPDSRLLINDRMGSRWPVRGAPVVHQGRVFFGVGIWPEEGVYVIGADLKTGKTIWRNDGMSFVEKGMSDHGNSYNLGLPPHGYLAIIDGKLAVPCARSLAAWFDPMTGNMEPYTSFYVKLGPPRGTWSVYGINQLAVHERVPFHPMAGTRNRSSGIRRVLRQPQGPHRRQNAARNPVFKAKIGEHRRLLRAGWKKALPPGTENSSKLPRGDDAWYYKPKKPR
jgi:outer membrane protein assembly factor BamB